MEPALVEEAVETRLARQSGASDIELDRAVDVADLIANEHVRDEGNREDRHGGEGEHEAHPESEFERRSVPPLALSLSGTQWPWPQPCEEFPLE